MAAKPGNKWKAVSKSVVGVIATKIATENPDKQFDSLKAFLDRTKKQMSELRSGEGSKEILEERLLKVRAIVITFENRKNQLDNVLEVLQQNEYQDTFKNEWNSCEEQMKNVVEELELVLEKWKQVDDFIEKIDRLLNQLETRRESCCALESAADITGRLQNLKEDNLKTCLSLLHELKSTAEELTEISKTEVATEAIVELEQKLMAKQVHIEETISGLKNRVNKENEYEKLRDKFRRELDNGLEVLKNIRNEECDTTELQTCLDLVKKLKYTRSDLEKQLSDINEQTKLFNIERYSTDYERISQIWLMFCNELDSCQKTLETQTSESRKVLYLLNSAQREISKGEQELKELQSINVNNKTELKQKFDRIKGSLKCLNDVYVTMESFIHQWEKLKKNGLSDVSVETKLQSASEALNALQYDFQTLQDKTEEMLNTVERVDEDCTQIKKNIKNIGSYLAKVRMTEEDTNSDIQAKLSKLDQKLWSRCWDLIENVESLTENLPQTFECRLEGEKLKSQLEESDKEFASVRTRLTDALSLLDQFNKLCNDVTVELNNMEKLLPNLKKLTTLDEKKKAFSECNLLEGKLKFLNSTELNRIIEIESMLSLNMCKKPAKVAKNKWKDLIQECLESKTKLSRQILIEQTKLNKRLEFKEWIESTVETIEQLINTVQFDNLNDVESLKTELNELHINLKDKQEELIELEADAERDDLEEQLSSMAKQVGTKLEALTTLSNMWAEFDQRMALLSSWLNRHIDRFKNSKDSSSLKDSVFTLKELQRDVQGKEGKINELNCDAQKLNEMTNSYCVLQQTCSLINLKSNFRDEIESEIQCKEKWLFIKAQLKYLHQQISSVCNTIMSLAISQDDLEDHTALVDEILSKFQKFEEDAKNIKKYDDQDSSNWPPELSSELSTIETLFVKLITEIQSKQSEIQKIVDAENEKRLLSVAKSHECTPAVFEIAEELPVEFEVHYMGGHRTSLKLNKFKRNRTMSSGLLRRKSSKLLLPRKKTQSEGENPEQLPVLETDERCFSAESVEEQEMISSTCSSTEPPIAEVVDEGHENINLWERVRDLAVEVRMIDLTKLLASTALKVLLAHLADARRLWLAHGDFDFYNFDEINLHQKIQFVQLDILQLIEDCCRLIDSSSIIDNIISHID